MTKHHTREDVLADMQDIGNGITEKTVHLKKGDTAWSPLSDKWIFIGPGEVIYTNHPSGMNVVVDGRVRKSYI